MGAARREPESNGGGGAGFAPPPDSGRQCRRYAFRRRRTNRPSPIRPLPSSSSEPGSGTAVVWNVRFPPPPLICREDVVGPGTNVVTLVVALKLLISKLRSLGGGAVKKLASAGLAVKVRFKFAVGEKPVPPPGRETAVRVVTPLIRLPDPSAIAPLTGGLFVTGLPLTSTGLDVTPKLGLVVVFTPH